MLSEERLDSLQSLFQWPLSGAILTMNGSLED
jgi:hypothetical protein